MGWLEFESFWFFCPDGTYELVGSKPFESLKPSSEVVGIDEVGQMLSEVLVGLIIEAFDGCVFNGAVHPLDLSIRPRMTRLGEAMFNVEFSASELKGVAEERLASCLHCLDVLGRPAVSAGIGEMRPVIGENSVHLIRHSSSQIAEEVSGDPTSCLLVQLDERELRGSVDCYK